MQKLVLAILTGLFIAGCGYNGSYRPIELTQGLPFQLLSPSSFGNDVYLTQAAEFWVNDDYHELLFYSEITSENITVVGLMPSGTRLFSIEFDGETISSDGFGIILNAVAPEYLLADFQLSQWPLPALVTHLQQTSNCFEAKDCLLTESPDQLQRTLFFNGREVISINYSGVPHFQHSLEFNHRLRDYRLRITTLEFEQL